MTRLKPVMVKNLQVIQKDRNYILDIVSVQGKQSGNANHNFLHSFVLNLKIGVS